MRVSTQQIFQNGLQRIQEINTQQARTQQQVSSGKRVLNPADDPIAATRILQLNNELSRVDQFQRNIDLAENRLQLEDSTLAGVNDVLIRIRELTVQAGNGALSADDREFIAAEMRQRLDQLAGLANTQDSTGDFIFAGFSSSQPAFEKNSSGAFVYAGDEGQRQLPIDTGVNVAINDNGKRVFTDIPANAPTFFTQASPQNQADPPATISAGMVVDEDAFANLFPEDIQLVIGQDPVTGANTYTATERQSGRILAQDVPLVSGEPIQIQGAQFEITGDPAVGDTFFVQTAEKQSVFTTVEKLIDGLENFSSNPASRQAFDRLVANSLANLDAAEGRVLETRAGVGARLNTVETTRQFHEDSNVLNREVLSDLEELDFAEAISRLSQQNFVLQAAQQSFAQISRLTLFDVL